MHSICTNFSSFIYYAWPVCEAIAFFLAQSLEKNGNYTVFVFKCVYIQGKGRPHLIVFELRGAFLQFHRGAEVYRGLSPCNIYENKQWKERTRDTEMALMLLMRKRLF